MRIEVEIDAYDASSAENTSPRKLIVKASPQMPNMTVIGTHGSLLRVSTEELQIIVEAIHKGQEKEGEKA